MSPLRLLCCCSAMAATLLLAIPAAEAVIVDRILSDGVTTPSDATPVNVTAPTDDPGWYRVPTNRSAIYLGNQWMLTAAHAGSSSTIEMPGGGVFEVVPNSDIILSNPSGNFGGVNLADDSDLRMFRIKTESTTGLTPEQSDPNLAADPFGSGLVTIASSAPTLGTEVLMIGNGRDRRINTGDPHGHSHFDDDTFHGIDGQPNQPGGVTPTSKTWGTNRIAADRLFETNRNDSDNVFPVEVNNRDVIGQVTQFDSTLYSYPNADAPTENEAQAAGGDSGGPVFFKQGAPGSEEWVLAGVLHAIQQEDGQPGRASIFGNLTILSDLSQPHYANQIDALLANDFTLFESESGLSTDLAGYSIAGDINMDGVVAGDGSGSIATDDLAAFVAGWRNEQAVGDVLSWQKGDLNLDGTTNLDDFVLLRSAYNGGVSASQLSSLLGGTATPEPSTLAVLASLFLAVGFRRERG